MLYIRYKNITCGFFDINIEEFINKCSAYLCAGNLLSCFFNNSFCIFNMYLQSCDHVISHRDEPLTREQIQIKIGDIEARLATLESMKGSETSGDAKAFIEKLEADEEQTKNQLDEATTGLDAKRLACMKATEDKAENKNAVCQEYRYSSFTKFQMNRREDNALDEIIK